MTGATRPAPYGRKRNSGSAALATLGDGWRPIGTRWPTGPFGTARESTPNPQAQALAAVTYVQRGRGRSGL